MKKTTTALLAATLMLGLIAGPADAKKKKKKPRAPKKVERQATADYQAPAIGFPEATWVCFRPTNSCGDIPIGGEEYYVKIEIADGSGTTTAFALGQDTDPDTVGTDTDYGSFCGTTGKQTIQIQPGFPLLVVPYAFGGALCSGSLGTAGTITATISNLP